MDEYGQIRARNLRLININFKESKSPIGWGDWHNGLRNFYDKTKDLDTINLINGSAKAAVGRRDFGNLGELRDAVLSTHKEVDYQPMDSLHITNINAIVHRHIASKQAEDLDDEQINDREFLESQHKMEMLYVDYRELQDYLKTPDLAQGYSEKYDLPIPGALQSVEDELIEEWSKYETLKKAYWDKKEQAQNQKKPEQLKLKEQIKRQGEDRRQKMRTLAELQHQRTPQTAKPKLEQPSVLRKPSKNPEFTAPDATQKKPHLRARLVELKKAWVGRELEKAKPVAPLSKQTKQDLRIIDSIRGQRNDSGPKGLNLVDQHSKTAFADRLHGYASGNVLNTSKKLGYTNEQALAYAKADLDYLKNYKISKEQLGDKSNFWVRQIGHIEKSQKELFNEGLLEKKQQAKSEKGLFTSLYEKAKTQLGQNKDWFDREMDSVSKAISKDVKQPGFKDRVKDRLAVYSEKVASVKSFVVDKFTNKNELTPHEQRRIDVQKLESRIQSPGVSEARQAYYERLKDYAMAGSKTMPDKDAESILRAQKTTANDIRILDEKCNSKGISKERKEFYGRLKDSAETALARIQKREDEYLQRTGYSSLKEGYQQEKLAKSEVKQEPVNNPYGKPFFDRKNDISSEVVTNKPTVNPNSVNQTSTPKPEPVKKDSGVMEGFVAGGVAGALITAMINDTMSKSNLPSKEVVVERITQLRSEREHTVNESKQEAVMPPQIVEQPEEKIIYSKTDVLENIANVRKSAGVDVEEIQKPVAEEFRDTKFDTKPTDTAGNSGASTQTEDKSLDTLLQVQTLSSETAQEEVELRKKATVFKDLEMGDVKVLENEPSIDAPVTEITQENLLKTPEIAKSEEVAQVLDVEQSKPEEVVSKDVDKEVTQKEEATEMKQSQEVVATPTEVVKEIAVEQKVMVNEEVQKVENLSSIENQSPSITHVEQDKKVENSQAQDSVSQTPPSQVVEQKIEATQASQEPVAVSPSVEKQEVHQKVAEQQAQSTPDAKENDIGSSNLSKPEYEKTEERKSAEAKKESAYKEPTLEDTKEQMMAQKHQEQQMAMERAQSHEHKQAEAKEREMALRKNG